MSFSLDVRVEREFTVAGRVSSDRDEVNNRLRAIRDALDRTQMRTLLQQVGEIYYDSTLERFRSQSEPSGQKWHAWAELTKKLRKTGVIGRGGQMHRPPAVSSVSVGGQSITAGKLIWTGKLIKAIKVAVRADRGTVQIGVNSAQVPYAWLHQMGHGKIPMRKFLGYTKKANEAAKKAISNYLMAQAFGISPEK